jgi:hypothetical protein
MESRELTINQRRAICLEGQLKIAKLQKNPADSSPFNLISLAGVFQPSSTAALREFTASVML